MGLIEDFEDLPLSSQLALVGAAGLGFIALAAILRKRAGDASGSIAAAMTGSISSAPSGARARSSEERISTLHPRVAAMARDLVKRSSAEGMPIVVTQALRTLDEQAKLYAQGRTAPGAIVTNSPPGKSWHNFGLAFDIAPLDATGQPHWPNDDALWQKLGAIGKSLGLKWGGEFKSFPDRPHFEFHPGLTIEDAQAGKMIA